MSDWRRIGTAVLATALWRLTARAAPPERISGRMTCPAAELIALVKHAREQGAVHVRGCWLLDLLLNKE